ncbi:hypothetical protein THAOC_32460, partial [Thalassiosira oceanica]
MSDDVNNSSGSESEDEVPSLVPWSEWTNIELDEDAVFGREQLILLRSMSDGENSGSSSSSSSSSSESEDEVPSPVTNEDG